MIDLKTRAVVIAGITHDLHQGWVVQAARGLLDAVDGFLKDARFLIHDRDPVFGAAFSKLLKSSGVRCVRLPSRSPNLNAYAERFVGSIRRECPGRVIPLGERHLQVLVAEYVEHYNLERNHQGVGNQLLGPAPAAPANDVAVGGLVEAREAGWIAELLPSGSGLICAGSSFRTPRRRWRSPNAAMRRNWPGSLSSRARYRGRVRLERNAARRTALLGCGT